MARLWIFAGAAVGAALVGVIAPAQPEPFHEADAALVLACADATAEEMIRSAQVDAAALKSRSAQRSTPPSRPQTDATRTAKPTPIERLGLTVRLVSA